MTDIEIAKQLFLDGLNLIQNKEFEQAEKKFLKSLELIPDQTIRAAPITGSTALRPGKREPRS